jgi:sugar phosphate isomerase/epimerase
MTGSIREYAKIGLVHHMLYTASTDDPKYHAETLCRFVERDDIEAFDFCVPYTEPYRSEALKAVKRCTKNKAYSLHLFPARKISLGSLDLTEREITKIIIRDQITQAAVAGAGEFVFISGADNIELRNNAKEFFYEFCLWFCAELNKYKITALLEPFDRFVDKKFLYGSIDECIDLVSRVRKKYDNIGIEFDVAHLPLMGEDICKSIRKCGRLIKRIHLGNCVLKDKKSKWYGDIHPPIGIEGGEINFEELKEILWTLIDIGYLDKTDKKPLIMEMRPFDGDATIEETIKYSFDLLEKAWREI